MCWSQKLYDAMIHVYNRGLHDYTTPLLELLLQLRAALKKGKPLPGWMVRGEEAGWGRRGGGGEGEGEEKGGGGEGGMGEGACACAWDVHISVTFIAPHNT